MIISYSNKLFAQNRKKSLLKELHLTNWLIKQYETQKNNYKLQLLTESNFEIVDYIVSQIRFLESQLENANNTINYIQSELSKNINFVHTDYSKIDVDTSNYIHNTHNYQSLKFYTFAPSYPVRF